MGIAESTVEKHLAKALLLTRDFMARHESSFDANTSANAATAVRRLRAGESE
jgi:hypothetical protein